jgi:protein tyrosine phosphatase (PTP) superfamily phosphohydrolase (DUF442 family)
VVTTWRWLDERVKRIPRPLRPVAAIVAGWLGVFLVVNLVIVLTGLVARWSGKDPRLDDDRWPGITHLRRVDDRLLVGGETSPDEYRELADRGVTLVIDARTGSATDASTDDPDHLAELGMEYARLAVPDGRPPSPAQTRRFLDLVESADGLVFAHCGGGVGRSTSLAAVYEAAQGDDPSTMEQLAVGPPTIEQIWFVTTLRPNHPEHRVNPAVAVVSRVVDAPRTLYGWVTSLF